MRNETVTLLERYYSAFNAACWEEMLDCLSEDVVHDLNQSERQTGKRAFQAFLECMNASYLVQLSHVSLMTNEDGSRAAVEYIVEGTYHGPDAGLLEATGQTYKLAGGAFFEVINDKISRVTNYYNLEDWLEQVKG
ncbi:MAG: nuclear transport factor 2 family protein [Pseudopedobacter sp.]|nr:nuclear transport factor 2 family protein [Deinococcales bacterium]